MRDGGEREKRADDEAVGVEEELVEHGGRRHPPPDAQQRPDLPDAADGEAGQQRPREPGVGEGVGQPAGDEDQHHADQALPNQQHQQRAEVVHRGHGDGDEVRAGEFLVRREHAPQRGVQHHERRGGGKDAEGGERLGLQLRRHVQQAREQRGQREPEQRGHQRGEGDEAEHGRAREPRQLLRRVRRHPLRDGAGQRRADAEVEDAEHADHGEREGEEAPALQPHQLDQEGGEGEGEQQRQPAAQPVPEHAGDQASRAGAVVLLARGVAHGGGA